MAEFKKWPEDAGAALPMQASRLDEEERFEKKETPTTQVTSYLRNEKRPKPLAEGFM